MKTPPTTSARGVVNTKERRLQDLVISSSNGTESVVFGTTNTNKEELCLEYVSNFYTQFKSLFPNRNLLLNPVNEHGVPKMVCTTLRPTLLPYKDLYDASSVANFVASAIEYEPLPVISSSPNDYDDDPMMMLPTTLVSPSLVLSWQVGDCFDMANLLASFLIGAGYDAYVVTGLAPRWICTQDTSAQALPAHLHAQSDYDNTGPEQKNDSSSFIHAWVLLRSGKRNVESHVFIEPSTGVFYNTSSSPYSYIESLWNNQNYYINMQENTSTNSMLFDFESKADWEYIFIKENENENENDKVVLDVPPSWITPVLKVPYQMYQKRFTTTGECTVLYYKAMVEHFAPFMHNTGLVLRVTLYQDTDRICAQVIYEHFENRRDHLIRRVRYPMDVGSYEETFSEGRDAAPEALAGRVEKVGRSREWKFYSRLDGLRKRTESINQKIIDIFEDRDDSLSYRSVRIASSDCKKNTHNNYTLPKGPQGELGIAKMTEKFNENNDNIKRRCYRLSEGVIQVLYHYEDGKLTASSREYPSVFSNDAQDIIVKNAIDTNQSTSTSRRPKDSILLRDWQEVLRHEKECYTEVRHREVEMQEILKVRFREESDVVLDKSVFDIAMEESEKINIVESSNISSTSAFESSPLNDDEEQQQQRADYLTPFINQVVKNKSSSIIELKRSDAIKVRELCLKSLKDRLLERANIIQSRLDSENSALAKKQAAFQRSQRDHDVATDEEFEKFCADTMFRISILEQRLSRHEESALQKYADLDQTLHLDARLASAFK